ncbi:MAG: sulfatase, partial [Casimicrobiaceae bacterium]
LFSVAELADATLAPPMPFTKGVPLLRVPATPKSPVYFGHGPGGQQDTQTVLYELAHDPGQVTPVRDAAVEARLIEAMTRLMRANDAPAESFSRLGLVSPAP